MKRCEKCAQALNGPEQDWAKISHMNYCGNCFEKLINCDESKLYTCTPVCKVCGKEITDEEIVYLYREKGTYCLDDLFDQIEALVDKRRKG